jgi:hypothetical protein
MQQRNKGSDKQYLSDEIKTMCGSVHLYCDSYVYCALMQVYF